VKVLLVHEHYQRPGGEDEVFRTEAELLRGRGHELVRYVAHNDSVRSMDRLTLARDTIWNRQHYSQFTALLRRQRPDIVHFHNTFPLISPSAHHAAKRAGIPVVQTLHNYRLLCPAATLFRHGRPCEDCVGRRLPWPAVVHRCYRESRAATTVVSAMLSAHRLIGTWDHAVDAYIALTEFARGKFIEGGLPKSKIHVKSNAIRSDPGLGSGDGHYALFVGRLTHEKGVDLLLAAWKTLGATLELKIAGDGPLAGDVAKCVGEHGPVQWLGHRTAEEIRDLMKRAYVLVVPSRWYEGFPVVVLEAFAAGLPVVTSAIGGLSEVVSPGRTGLHFNAGDANDLTERIRWLISHPEELQRMRAVARSAYEDTYGADKNYQTLMGIYRAAGAGHGR
jgi:glycosyltransferase involved in cell wall biosynthesis